VWKGKRRHCLDCAHFYRYIYPSYTDIGLSSFYGQDRSFCQGILFDTTDFIIEFSLNDGEEITPIYHHQNSYRGTIDRNNTEIIAIYVKQQPMDYDKSEFTQHFEELVTQLPVGAKVYRYEICDDLTDCHVNLKSIWIKSDDTC
jgi:hypothetical protein